MKLGQSLTSRWIIDQAQKFCVHKPIINGRANPDAPEDDNHQLKVIQ